tara:strand:+ start:50 stop:811 length:762 start_codon:yes stop_codon:yes gene_type:complete
MKYVFSTNDLTTAVKSSNKKKKIVILTGPQGSGNHLWSKVFSLHEDVFGWKTLLDNYWEAHRLTEPFAAYWRDPSTLKEFDWSQSDYYFTSISVPLGIESKGTKWSPNIMQFAMNCELCGLETQICVIGRDQNILDHQQFRIREENTCRHFLDQLPNFENPIFLSYELLYLYKEEYLKTLELPIPVAWYDERLEEILRYDANLKYISPVEEQILDDGNKTSIPFPTNPVNKELWEKPARGDYLDCCGDKPCHC